MRIALDLDGVLADVILSWIKRNNLHRAPLTKEQITSWDFWKDCGIDKHDFYRELSECWRSWKTIRPTEKNLSNSTKRLSELGHLDIVTARERSTDKYAKRWLETHEISFENYVTVAQGTLKAELDYDLFIDDSPLNAAALIQMGRRVFLYEQPWNQNLSSPEPVRISSLVDAIQLLT